MNHLNSAREHITSAFQATGENQMRSLRCAQVHAQIASAESLQRIAVCLETLVEVQTPDAPDATPDPLADLAPDWSQAPEWAQWWAVDDDGGCHWYADRPRPTDTQWLPPRLPSRYSTAGEIAWTMADWRQCIWQRPQAQEATRPDWLPEWRGG